MLKNFKTIEEMEGYISSKIHGAFSIMDMYVLSDYVRKLKSGDKYLEVGVDYGKSAATAIFQAPEGIEFFFCDIIDRQAPGVDYPQLLSRKDFFKSENLDSVATFIQEDSKHLSERWEGLKLSMIFIDADHSYQGCKTDIENWTKYLKSGGFMLFHDYDQPSSPGVVKAVNELVRDSGEFKDFFIGKEKFNMTSSIVGATKL